MKVVIYLHRLFTITSTFQLKPQNSTHKYASSVQTKFQNILYFNNSLMFVWIPSTKTCEYHRLLRMNEYLTELWNTALLGKNVKKYCRCSHSCQICHHRNHSNMYNMLVLIVQLLFCNRQWKDLLSSQTTPMLICMAIFARGSRKLTLLQKWLTSCMMYESSIGIW